MGVTILTSVIFAALVSPTVRSHETITTKITWSREISRIFIKRCISCHHQGGTSFDLSTYQHARPWAVAIKEEVLERRMPPWGAIKGFGKFINDRGLTEEEIELISQWVVGGAPEGDPDRLPEATPKDLELPVISKEYQSLSIQGDHTLKRAIDVIGIQLAGAPEGASLQMIAEYPGGKSEPLIWIYEFNPRFTSPFLYATPLHLPAGTRIRMTPFAGSAELLFKP